MEKLLYYPFISIPKADWLVQALLYWDGIATIVPLAEQRSLRSITPFARRLIQDGLIESVSPEEYAYSQPDSFISFLDWVQSNQSRFVINDNSRNNIQRVHIGKLNSVHIGKLGFLGDEFVKIGVAQRQGSQWYELNKNLALYFMTFLAILIGKQTEYIPTTDQYRGLSCLINIDTHANAMNATRVKDRFRSALLKRLLPVPSRLEDYYDIYRFKEKYHDQLILFRRKIETFLISLNPYSEEDRCRLCDAFCIESREEIEEIKRNMSFFKAPQVNMGTLIAALPSIIEFASNNVVTGSIGLIPVIGELIYNGDRKSNVKKPLAYAALYNKRFL